MRDISKEPEGFQLFCWMVQKIYKEELYNSANTEEGKIRKEKIYQNVLKEISSQHDDSS